MTWEISRIGFKKFWQTDRRKTVTLLSPTKRRSWLSLFVTMRLAIFRLMSHAQHSFESVFYPAAGRSAVDRDPGRCFIFLLRAAPCYCAGPDNFANG